MATKKQMLAFNNSIEKRLIEIGANKVKGHYTEAFGAFCYEVETKAGKMFVTSDEPEKGEIFSIFVRFDEPEKVKSFIPHIYFATGGNGKWNVHELDVDSAMDCLEYRLSKAITK